MRVRVGVANLLLKVGVASFFFQSIGIDENNFSVKILTSIKIVGTHSFGRFVGVKVGVERC